MVATAAARSATAVVASACAPSVGGEAQAVVVAEAGPVLEVEAVHLTHTSTRSRVTLPLAAFYTTRIQHTCTPCIARAARRASERCKSG